MKILFTSHKFHPDVGGIEVNSEILATAFQAAGHEVRLVTWSADPAGKPFPFSVVRNPGIGTLLKLHRWADVVYENNPCLRLSWPAPIFGKPLIVALRTWVSRIDGTIAWQDRLKQGWLRRAAAVIAVSDAIRARCWPPAIVIGNPYREKFFRVLPDVPRDLDFAFLGRLVSDKGAAFAVRALADLGGEFTLSIIGDGPERAKLEQTAAELGVAERVTFTGVLRGEDLVKHLNRHRFLLVPSMWEEPFGNVALEGLGCGCLPIVSDGGGLPDAVGGAGLVFQRGNLESFVSAIRSVLETPELEKRLRDAAPAHLANHHPDVVARRYLDVIEKGAARTK